MTCSSTSPMAPSCCASATQKLGASPLPGSLTLVSSLHCPHSRPSGSVSHFLIPILHQACILRRGLVGKMGTELGGWLECCSNTWSLSIGFLLGEPNITTPHSLPSSSTALTSAWLAMSSSTMPSTARRAARISAVEPSAMRASRSVERFRIRI